MSPQKQLAQKLNAQSSTGPRTEAGKAQSSQNRVTHGLCSKKHAIHPSQRAEFERHYHEMLAALAPEGAEEATLSEAIILDQFRMARARELENEIFAKGMFDAEHAVFGNAETWAKHAKELALLTLYSQRIHRVLIRNQADLAARQAARKAQASASSPTKAVECTVPPVRPASADFPPHVQQPETPIAPDRGFLRSSVAPLQSSIPAQAPFPPALAEYGSPQHTPEVEIAA